MTAPGRQALSPAAGWRRINLGSTRRPARRTGAAADTHTMAWYDYLINAVLIALVLFQIHGRRITIRNLALPVVIVAFVAFEVLNGIPTSGNDLVLVVAGAAAGLLLGAGCGLATAVYRRADGAPMARAGVLAAVLWVAGTGARLAFYLYSTHGGGEAIYRFSVAHRIIGIQAAWTACLVLMALAEVVSRSGVLAARYAALGRPPEPAPELARASYPD